MWQMWQYERYISVNLWYWQCHSLDIVDNCLEIIECWCLSLRASLAGEISVRVLQLFPGIEFKVSLSSVANWRKFDVALMQSFSIELLYIAMLDIWSLRCHWAVPLPSTAHSCPFCLDYNFSPTVYIETDSGLFISTDRTSCSSDEPLHLRFIPTQDITTQRTLSQETNCEMQQFNAIINIWQSLSKPKEILILFVVLDILKFPGRWRTIWFRTVDFVGN